MRVLALAVMLLAPLACKKAAAPSDAAAPAAGPSWTASKGGRVALRFSKGPGPITSTALPTGAGRPPENPFLNAAAMDPAAEDDLRAILDRSTSFDQFVGNLRAAGYDVARDTAPR